ncbi:hypothetical protein SGQ83_13375 [Flavobacterium sp. Fl-318]|uniref:Uncharacterized protein n=1 Tax=Flavobacterium cupriresistens TaxID=2893885 RepID=A0ABU4RDJ5_9FLAO|nr:MULTISPECIES: hypothetical protein [unclassified Flavobacterium]MDX6190346.1 hypothetical protein [Flavobacterium sp. Fl-318]UFH43413.1 hypothetical protein LNP23_04145 [Flavobacterium sp. F-323]
MKIQYLFILAFFISCQKEKNIADIPSVANQENKTEEVTIAKEKFLKTDTISFYETAGTTKNSYILAHLLNQKIDKDSVITGNYQLDFYRNKIKTASSKLTIKGTTEGSEWSASYGLSASDTKNSSFIQISYGYPACGYAHDNYLYQLNNNNLELVHEWITMSDSGWGSSVELTNPSGKSNPDFFYCKRVAFEPDDENEEMGYEKHYDSIVFQLKNKLWTKKMLSVEDKPYFEKKRSFDEFHKQQ